MIPSIAWLKGDNVAVNRFPSCNEEEIMVMGSVYPRRAAWRKENLLAGRRRVGHQHCHFAARQQSSGAGDKAAAQAGTENTPKVLGVEKGQICDGKKRSIFSVSRPSLKPAEGRLFPFLEGLRGSLPNLAPMHCLGAGALLLVVGDAVYICGAPCFRHWASFSVLL